MVGRSRRAHGAPGRRWHAVGTRARPWQPDGAASRAHGRSLTTLPFTQHFGQLAGPRRWVYEATFFSTVLALVLFVVPASYHRLARPIRHKERFKAFANRFLVAGLVPMSVAIVLATYLVSYVALNGAAIHLAGAIAVLIILVWWAAPLVRMHDHLDAIRRSAPPPPRSREAGGEGGGHDDWRPASSS